MSRGINSFDGILGQCMYFGLSFSRVGVDFRGLMVPIFTKVIEDTFVSNMEACDKRFEQQMEHFTLINKAALYSRTTKLSEDTTEGEQSDTVSEYFSPPESLLDFYPLACLCNGFLNILNDLRLCAPTALASIVTERLQQSLEKVGMRILIFYKQEQQAFTANERSLFNKLCFSFAYDLLNYLQRCIDAIFPPDKLCAYLGINQNSLKEIGITTLKHKEILEPVKHLIPARATSEDTR